MKVIKVHTPKTTLTFRVTSFEFIEDMVVFLDKKTNTRKYFPIGLCEIEEDVE